MFYALATGAIDTGPFRFEHILRDIQTLNDWAKDGKLDVTAISVHAYAYVHDTYAILSSGASMGATELARYEPDDPHQTPRVDPATTGTGVHGPLLVSARPMSLAEAAAGTIAVPGTTTSAWLVLQLALGETRWEVMDFDEILGAVENGTVQAGLIIHEGQLTYRRHHLHCLLDLGLWWFQQTQLPLPLGCNVVRRDLGTDTIAQLSDILRRSIQYSLEHRAEAIRYALQFGRDLDASLATEFVGLYVNQWTIDYGPVGRRAVGELLSRAAKAQLIPKVPPIEFV